MIAAFLLALILAPTGAAHASPSPTPVPTPTPVPAPVAWLGATLGETSADLRSQLGKPREILGTNVGDLWRYDADNGNVTLEVVVSSDKVESITARVKPGKQSALADPLGGALGMSVAALEGARGAPGATYDSGGELAYQDAAGLRWNYGIDSGVVFSISIWAPTPVPVQAQVVSDASHDGTTLAKAFIVKATSQSDATNAELSFMHTLACGDGGDWQVIDQELVTAGGGFFDLYHVVCTTTKAGRDIYFDVSESYAHP